MSYLRETCERVQAGLDQGVLPLRPLSRIEPKRNAWTDEWLENFYRRRARRPMLVRAGTAIAALVGALLVMILAGRGGGN